MEYNPDEHSIKCPKCGHGMNEITYGGDVVIDRCTHCQGLWFDTGEAEALKGKWMGDALDLGDPDEGKKMGRGGRHLLPALRQGHGEALGPGPAAYLVRRVR